MKKVTLLIFFLTLILRGVSFGQNPYKSLGVPMPKGKMLTVSNGKFQEFFPNDTLTPIGSVMYNTITGDVVQFLTRDTMYAEYNLEPELVSRWLSPDPLAEKYYQWSPYTYGVDNPIRFIDPDGRQGEDVIIKGKEKQEAFNQLQASVQKELTLSMDANGKVTYSQNGTGKLSKDAKQLAKAVDDNSIVVNVNAENTTTTKSGNLYIGGAFSGNTVTKGTNGNSVVAEQEVNPDVLGKMSTAQGKAGADILHEVTEAYQGGLISQKSGVSSPASNQPSSVYPTAHNRATNQSGQVFERLYDASGNQMQMTPTGGYPSGVKSVDWYVNDKKGNKVIIQTLK